MAWQSVFNLINLQYNNGLSILKDLRIRRDTYAVTVERNSLITS
jgi:hypothetical protein